MDILCNTICFFEPKYYNKEYKELAFKFKSDIEAFLNTPLTDDESKFLRLVLKFYEILENDSGLRSNLIRFRNELELYKQNTDLDEIRLRLIELNIQTINVIHYGTLYCTSKVKFDNKATQLKDEFQAFKEWTKENRASINLNKIEKFYVSYLYRIPKLMKVKRGFKKIEKNDKNRSSLAS
ncbi:unnamed protein product [Brachionus calyciflorus]|uniref:Uncharacterized protein n=1 Tax=Brachionus calyciflorus TaxID=104777 RepID=A0A813MR31_9BILA|nr:unnamed protein product [Brachionus calyciflorus]